jgi:hypothetical protein
MAFFPFEKDPISRKASQMKLALECIAAKGAYVSQVLGIDEDPSLAVVFVSQQMDQFPGGIAVEIPYGIDMPIAVSPSNVDLEILAHALFSMDGVVIN